jgi:hypothetical protein
MTNQREIRVTSIGHIAHQAMLRSPAGYVTGTTSQGIFLQLHDDLTLFLSRDPFRGPLTINIRDRSGALRSIQTEDIVEYEGKNLRFKRSGVEIIFNKPLIWKTKPPPLHQNVSPEYIEQILECVEYLKTDHLGLAILRNLTEKKYYAVRFHSDNDSSFFRSFREHKAGNPEKYISEMKLLLGEGPGLTPLGDDLILGILLTMIRIRGQSFWADDKTYHFQSVVNSAKEKTTRISWSLLYCALQGSADERIIRIQDGLIAAREIPDQDLENLLNWGDSSGMAVLAGMLLALS